MVAVLINSSDSASGNLGEKVVLQRHTSNRKEPTRSLEKSACNNIAGWRSRGWTPLKYPKSSFFLTKNHSDSVSEHEHPDGNDDDKQNVYFPFHQDVIVSCVRELLILDGTLDGSTLKVSPEAASLEHSLRACDKNNEGNFSKKRVASAGVVDATDFLPMYLQHLEPRRYQLLRAVALASESHTGGNRKRLVLKTGEKKRKMTPLLHTTTENDKRCKKEPTSSLEKMQTVADDHGGSETKAQETSSSSEGKQPLHPPPPMAEQIANAILLRSRIRAVGSEHSFVSKPALSPEASDSSVVDATVAGEGVTTEEEEMVLSHFLDFSQRTPPGAFALRVLPENIPSMVHTSISTEAILRDAAMTMTTQLVESFTEAPLRLFLGYKKAPTVVGRDRLIRVLAAFLLDASHAMFAWEQEQQEFLFRYNQHGNSQLAQEKEQDMDFMLQKTLFDARALGKIGGFEPSSILPHAISIGRLRRRRCGGLFCHEKYTKLNRHSWEFFATTAQGKRMLAHHHGRSSTVLLSVGKRRRGQRLRQRHWLTSSLLWNETDGDASTSASSSSCPAETRSRTSSIASYDDSATAGTNNFVQVNASGCCDTDNVLVGARLHQVRVLAEMPGTMVVTLVKESFGISWGVLLSKEGDMCVVVRGAPAVGFSKPPQADQQLECGDLIIHVQNDHGQEAATPMCVTSSSLLSAAHNYSGNKLLADSEAVGLIREDWFRAIVDLFKTSTELHVIIQRVRVTAN
jgi:hypothetical protein